MNKILVIVLGFLIFSLLVAPVSAQQQWYCSKWQITVTHHKSYTTFYPIIINKVLIEEPLFHPAYDTQYWKCTGYWQKTKSNPVKKVWVNKDD